MNTWRVTKQILDIFGCEAETKSRMDRIASLSLISSPLSLSYHFYPSLPPSPPILNSSSIHLNSLRNVSYSTDKQCLYTRGSEESIWVRSNKPRNRNQWLYVIKEVMKRLPLKTEYISSRKNPSLVWYRRVIGDQKLIPISRRVNGRRGRENRREVRIEVSCGP